jgi:acyl-CoA thioester hydrolase
MSRKSTKKPFSYEYVVSWADTDALGIMHFSNYFRLCERAEQFFFESRKLKDDRIFLPRVHASCNFKSPLRFRDVAKVSVKIKEVGKRHLTMDYSIENLSTKKLSAECQIVVVAVDEKLNPAHIDQDMIKKLA